MKGEYHMKPFSMLSFLLIAVLVFYSTSEAESWEKFFTNRAGYDFFYDKDSIVYPTKGTVQVWYKSVPTEDADVKAWVEWVELREVDCTRRRYRTLAGRVIYQNKPTEKLQESSWIYSEPGDLEDTFYRTICKGKNK